MKWQAANATCDDVDDEAEQQPPNQIRPEQSKPNQTQPNRRHWRPLFNTQIDTHTHTQAETRARIQWQAMRMHEAFNFV